MGNEFIKYETRGAGYHWEQVSSSFRLRNPYVHARYRQVVRCVGDGVRNASVLDVGCGDGVLSWQLSEVGANVSGIDTSEEAIAFATQKCAAVNNIEFRVGSAYELPFPDASFDYVVSTELIEHLDEPGRMLAEMNRVWNRNGRIVITTPIRITRDPLDKMHVQEYFTEDFEALVTSHFTGDRVELAWSHPLFWQEFQNRQILGRSFTRALINLANRLGMDPYLGARHWRYFTLQTAIIRPAR